MIENITFVMMWDNLCPPLVTTSGVPYKPLASQVEQMLTSIVLHSAHLYRAPIMSCSQLRVRQPEGSDVNLEKYELGAPVASMLKGYSKWKG